MKKNDWILLGSVFLYSFLFYDQSPGINFLIFNISLISGLILKNNPFVKNKKWKLTAGLCLLTAFASTIHGSGLPVLANVIALSLLSAFSVNPRNSFLVSLAFSGFSYFTSLFYMVSDWQKRSVSDASKTVPSFKRSFLIIIPVLISLIFLGIYRSANPLFDNFISKINLDFISFRLILFTIGGFILLYGFYYHRRIKFIAEMDANSLLTISNIPAASTLFGKTLSHEDELFSGKLLFILLNIFILIVNILDIDFLFISHTLPDGVTYSQFVHQGIGALILSIAVSIFIILFYFRGALNFSSDNKLIRILAYLWIVQNIVMLISTALRNGMYIQEYGLTYKRIGVFVYLLLTVIGLITTFLKIVNFKTASYLLRVNSWLFYLVLVVACFFNWDNLITSYNIRHSGQKSFEYLLTLSETNLPSLFRLKKEESKMTSSKINFDTISKAHYRKQLSIKLYNFNSNDTENDWRSWNYDNMKLKAELKELNTASVIDNINLANMGLYSLNALNGFWNISILDVSSNYITSVNEVLIFPGLTKLNLQNNRITELNGIENLQRLEYLDVSGNYLKDLSPLLKLNHLRELQLPVASASDQVNKIQQHFPELEINFK